MLKTDWCQIGVSSPYFKQAAQYDLAGNLIGLNSDEFSYNELNELVREKGGEYKYDERANRIQKNDSIYQYSEADKWIEGEYDFRGNWKKDPSFVFDGLNRLVEAKGISFRYDPLGRKIGREVEGKNERILFDGSNELAVYQDKLTMLRVPGKRGVKGMSSPIAIEIGDEVLAPVHNIVGDIIGLADAEGQLVHQYRYSSFGELTYCEEKKFNPWRYRGKRFEPHLNIYDFGKRHYDPEMGRWLSVDPAGFLDSANLYQYCLNNPYFYVDPDGEFVFIVLTSLTVDALIKALIVAAVVATLKYMDDWVNTDYDPVAEKWKNEEVEFSY